MIKWPQRARSAIIKLFEPLQDIDVFIEDEDDEAFYKALLNTASNGTVTISRVFSLGGRAAVVEAAKTYDDHMRRALFIVDGDLMWVRGEQVEPIPRLHQHEAYCIENLLLCEKAVTTLVSQELAETEEVVQQKIAFGEWAALIREPLANLFAAFATSNSLSPNIATISTGVGIYCTVGPSKKTQIDRTKIEAAKNRLLWNAAQASNQAAATNLYQEIQSRIAALSEPLLAVSGKNFLLPLLDFHLQSLGCKIRRHSLRMRLACSGDRRRFARLAAAMENTARGHF